MREVSHLRSEMSSGRGPAAARGDLMNRESATDLGVRERKKQVTRSALSWAAMNLAVERGLDNVLVEDIAVRAGVSPRTFNNYFSSKYEAICAIAVDRSRRISEALRERPATEPLWTAITHAVLKQYKGAEKADRNWIASIRLVTSAPQLKGEYLNALAEEERAFADAIAERTGTHVQLDMFPRLVAGAVTTAANIAIDHWLDADPPRSLLLLLKEAFGQLAAGLPPPARRGARSRR
jgi:AcrR family transcriptional regulator